MASSLENNKILAAIITAGIFASGAGVMSRIIYHPAMPEEPSYIIEVAAEGEGGAGDEDGGETMTVAALLPAADVAGGESGAKKCAACHSFDEGGDNKIGPNLYGILGRDIGSVAGFAYSDALAGLEGGWDYDALDAFLAKPKDYAPGTKMAYAGMKSPEARADLILYLRSLAADPLPLPEAEAVETEAAEETGGDGSEGADAEETAEAGDTEEAETEDAAEAEAAVDEAEEVAEETVDAADEVAKAASDVVEGAEETAAEVAEAATDAASETAEAAGDAAADAAETAKDAVEGAAEKAADTKEAVSDAAGDAVAAASGAAGAVTAAAGDAAADAEEAVEGAADDAASGLVAMIAGGDVAKGEKVSKKCKACHVFDEGGKNKLGPALWGIVNRDIASHDGFKYSGALGELEGEWTYDKLDQFLAAPKAYVPGTRMVFAGVKKEQDRADLIAYLRSLDAEPAPLN